METKKFVAEVTRNLKEKKKQEAQEKKLAEKKMQEEERMAKKKQQEAERLEKKKKQDEERAAKRARYSEKLRTTETIAPLDQDVVQGKRVNMFDEFR